MKEGRASSGCGNDVAKVHQKACQGDMPFDTSTEATARPSGTLCSPIATVTSRPCKKIAHLQGGQRTDSTTDRHPLCVRKPAQSYGSNGCVPMTMQPESRIVDTGQGEHSLQIRQVCRIGGADLGPAALATEGHANTRALPQGMRCHDAYNEDHLACVCATQTLKLHIFKLLQPPLADPDEQRPCTHDFFAVALIVHTCIHDATRMYAPVGG